MTRPAVRLALLMIFLAAMGATAYLFWMAERQSQLTETTLRAFDASARAAESIVFDLRTAQQAYVAAGQGVDFWISRTTALTGDLKSRVAWLKSDAGPASASAFDDALSALDDFEHMDLRARDYARNRQSLQASDLIFTAGLDLTRKMSDAIERARTAEVSGRDSVRAALQRREAFSLGAAAAAATLIVLLLMPSRRPARPIEAAAQVPTASSTSLPADDTSLALDSFDALDADESWTPAAPMPAAPTSGVTPAPAPAVDLQAVAIVCNDLARVIDTRALPELLERTAGVLDASGIILWIADPDGRELAPIVTHGYASNLVTRLGTIARDAQNATAAAYRTSLLQTVKADAVSNGAIAAPLVTPAGCVGVMAAEVRHDAERQDTVLAAASIVAAQLAALVGPPSSRAKAEAVS
ncbi:MAG: hypothetical protein DMF84_16530 [Acidobacteria bacterium]|nr:MAG: hypothetical protein DMF84_16530 [Acidobacteriota bacterium]